MGAGIFWDAGNALGFAAFAGLLYLTITSSRRLDVRAHQLLGYGVLAVAVAHAFWFMLGDGAVIDYQFNTTDVCMIVKTDQLTAKYERRYRKPGTPEPMPA